MSKSYELFSKYFQSINKILEFIWLGPYYYNPEIAFLKPYLHDGPVAEIIIIN